MSEHKPAHVVASVNTGMMVGNGKQYRRYRPHTRLWGIVALCLIVVGGAGWLGYSHFSANKSSSSSGKPTTNTASQKVDISKYAPDQQAQYYADQGQYESAEQSWQDQLASAKTTDDKVAIYYQQATVAIRFKQYGDAKKYADSIKEVAPDAPDSYVVLAQLAKAQGNIPQAKQYWQQAINHINADTPADKMIRSDYINQMDALK